MSKSTTPNRLSHEKSPYLLQHAFNPVDWYAWGEEAFQKAREEEKPIFLSVGYSTCHWCHVMEKESFENEAVAKLLNQSFVSIKVDREERPDVDQVYMQAVMAITGAGGWPMSVFLTPDLKPFFGGTYFPPDDRWGRAGFMTVLNTIAEKWQADRPAVIRSGEEITRVLEQETKRSAGQKTVLTESILQKAFEQFANQYDAEFSGFGPAPKFPRSHTLLCLLRCWKRTGNAKALSMVETTLEAMRQGGLFDQLGGGFHRYSTDRKWHIPHFEKMLYDQALLARAYLEAYQATEQDRFAQVAREVFDYVLRDLTSPEGGFYSAEDADSAEDKAHPQTKTEGAFYVWTYEEFKNCLGENAEPLAELWGVKPEGNAEEDPHGEFIKKNILFEALDFADWAKKCEWNEQEALANIQKAKERLLGYRNQRPRPHLDDKVLTDWNGLMISSLAYGSVLLEDERYIVSARRSADFILDRLQSDGDLLHRYRDNHAAIPGFLEDYAFFIQGLLDIYECGFEIKYLEEAVRLAKKMIQKFWDDEAGGFFNTSHEAETLILRMKEVYDGAIPSGNSMAVCILVRLARMTGDKLFEEKACGTLEFFSEALNPYPAGYPQMMVALDDLLGPSCEIILAGDYQDSILKQGREILNRVYLPRKSVILYPQDKRERKRLEELIPLLKNYQNHNEKTIFYVCRGFACDLPISDPARLEEKLKAL